MVTDDPAEAMRLVQQGADVVLIVSVDGAASVEAGLPQAGEAEGRLAVIVGEPADPATRSAAEEMDAELFSTRR